METVEGSLRLTFEGPDIVDVIVDLFERPNRPIRQRELVELGAAGARLKEWGALEETAHATSIDCPSCDAGHEVELDLDPDGCGYRYFCSSDGWVQVDEQDIRAFRFDVDWLIRTINEQMPNRRPACRELIDELLWELGMVKLDHGSSVIFLARDARVHIDAIIHHLRRANHRSAGLLLTTTENLPSCSILPAKHRWLELRHCLDLQASKIVMRNDALLASLQGSTGKPGGRPGRPGAGEQIKAELRRRIASGQCAIALHDEAEALGCVDISGDLVSRRD